jgi:hypothetical protein
LLSSQPVDPAGRLIRNRFFIAEAAFFGTAIWSLFSKETFYPLYLLFLLPLGQIYRLIKDHSRKRKESGSAELAVESETSG